MERGGKIILNRNKKRRISYKDKGSDDSDDDYVLEEDEESNGSEEFCASADDNASEEGFDFRAMGICSDDEDEVDKKKVVRSRGSKSKENSLDRKRTRVRQPCKRTGVSDDEEYCFDDDDDYDDYDDDEDEDGVEKQKVVRSRDSKSKENSVGRKRTRVRQPNKRTSVSDDEEYCFDDDAEDEVEKQKVLRSRGSKSKENSVDRKRTRVRQPRKRTSVSYDEEEYCFDDDDEEDEVEKQKVLRSRCSKSKENSVDRKRTRVRQPSKRTSVSDDEEESWFFDDEEDEVEKQKVLRSRYSKSKENSVDRKRTRVRQPSKRTSVSDDEEEYCFDDDDDEEDEVNKQKVVRSRGLKLEDNSLDRKRMRVSQPSKRTSVSDDEEYCFDDENDDDDEEFAPDGIDSVDEEEELQVNKKSNKVTKRSSRKKNSIKSRKRKRKSKVSMKPLKKERGILGVRKAAESSDEDFVDSISVVREKSRKETRKKNKMATDWDSGSACSDSSDLEYTISEEEKESLKEAIKFCGDLKTSLRNSSPSKRLQVDGAFNCQQQRPMGRKGKATISDLQNDTGKQVCGICLSEEGNGVVRGTLNCCSHYFCFACIMEWSKVESRCPLCKQRFVRIARSPRSDVGIDLRNSVIQVPKRDQVYRPSEEEVRGYFDPYENVICMECHQGGDDNLMLLCDICDSPAHTYCVGLQREVPEGNWYCEGCRISEAGSSNSLVRDPVAVHEADDCNLPSYISTRRISSEDLVPPSQYSVSVPEPSFAHGFGNLLSPRYPVRDIHAASPSGAGPSTLLGRRRVHRQVHDRFSSYRENQMAEMVARPASIYHIDLNRDINFEAEQCEEETIARHAGTSLSNGFNTAVEDSVQNRVPLSARLSHLRQVASLGTSSAITSGSANVNLRSECERTNTLLGSEQFNQCIIRSDDSISPHTYRESSCLHGESAK